MNTETTQDRVHAFVLQHSLEASTHARILDLTSEVGEVAKEFLTSTSYGQKEFHSTPEWRDEIGDVYFALLCLANASGVDLEDALRESMAKYEHHLREVAGPDVRESDDLES